MHDSFFWVQSNIIQTMPILTIQNKKHLYIEEHGASSTFIEDTGSSQYLQEATPSNTKEEILFTSSSSFILNTQTSTTLNAVNINLYIFSLNLSFRQNKTNSNFMLW